ncbi:hypothetical protein [Hymenobacter cellulosivorans]|uniref:BZIP transcription factor n=1 Tax=Hymenobacter cellulosivorans TaxID=2932249 RepID=A0ABY4F8T2_9BACT|nr:hypothetical protein [Hymenobacter cellulosivorans]UOQ52527.1 hypothetical protein MUN80_22595 [Hymenobacter cellulosivorans]
MQSAAAQTTPTLNGNSLTGNQTTSPFYITAAPANGEGPYVEMVNNSSANPERAGSIGYIAGFNAANPAGISHTFYSRTAGGSWVSHMRVLQNGQIQIGQRQPAAPHNDYRLAVDGKLVAQSLYITNPSTWADYVFAPTYRRMPLADLEAYLLQNKHLPAIPAAAEVERKGYNVSEMDAKLLQSVEELTLYVIELNKQNQQLQARTAELEKALSASKVGR